MLGYGTGTAWFKKGPESKTDDNLVASIKTAIDLQFTHLDGAEVYKTESELGTAIKQSKVARETLYVTTKVSPNIEDIPNALKTSLKKLGLSYVDLYLIHEPFFAKGDDEKLRAAWKAMEDMKDQGLAKSIGVSNFLPKQLEAILPNAKHKPVMNQIEFNPYLQHPNLLDYHKKHGIATAAYGPLVPITKAAPGPIDGYLDSLAKKYAVNSTEILLRWCVEQDVIVITTSSKEQRLSDYLRCCTFKLTPKEVEEIKALGEKKLFRQFWKGNFEDTDFD